MLQNGNSVKNFGLFRLKESLKVFH